MQPIINHHLLNDNRLHCKLSEAEYNGMQQTLDIQFDNEICVIPYELSNDDMSTGVLIVSAVPVIDKNSNVHLQQKVDGIKVVVPTHDEIIILLEIFQVKPDDDLLEDSSASKLLTILFDSFTNIHTNSINEATKLFEVVSKEKVLPKQPSDALTLCVLHRELANTIQQRTNFCLAFVNGLH